jgi:hypothetical protein
MTQQAFVLWFAEDANTNLGSLNALLGQGWRVAFASPMSGTGESGQETPQSAFPYCRAAVVLSRSSDHDDEEQAFVLWFGDDGNTNLAQLNALLGDRWNVTRLLALSGTGEHGPETPQSAFPYSRALAVLKRS